MGRREIEKLRAHRALPECKLIFCHQGLITCVRVTVREDVISRSLHPSHNVEQIAHKCWHVTSQHGRAARRNKLVVDFYLKSLLHHQKEKNKIDGQLVDFCLSLTCNLRPGARRLCTPMYRQKSRKLINLHSPHKNPNCVAFMKLGSQSRGTKSKSTPKTCFPTLDSANRDKFPTE